MKCQHGNLYRHRSDLSRYNTHALGLHLGYLSLLVIYMSLKFVTSALPEASLDIMKKVSEGVPFVLCLLIPPLCLLELSGESPDLLFLEG